MPRRAAAPKDDNLIDIKRRVGQRVRHMDFQWTGRIIQTVPSTQQFSVLWDNGTTVQYGFRTINVESLSWVKQTFTMRF